MLGFGEKKKQQPVFAGLSYFSLFPKPLPLPAFSYKTLIERLLKFLLMPSLLDHLRSQLPTLPLGGRYFLGFSGGLDSTVLLHALVSLRLDIPVVAVHINHQLSPHAAEWQAHCEALARTYQVEYLSRQVFVQNSGKGIEEAARRARYEVFAELLNHGDCFLTAHHADDQVETVLLHLVRGTGVKGLQGMARERRLGKGQVLRPLLDLPQSALRDYAHAHDLHWVEDESNQDEYFARNFLRLQVLPLLEERWPNFSQRWSAAIQSLGHVDRLNEELACLDLQAARPKRERVGHSMEYPGLLEQSMERFNNGIRYWLRELDASVPEKIHLQQLREQLQQGNDTQMEVAWGGSVLRGYGRRLYCLPRTMDERASIQDSVPLHWPTDSVLTLPDGSRLSAVLGQGGLKFAEHYRVDFRRGGERCQPSGRAHSQTLKKLLQEYALEPWLRSVVPLIYVGEQLVAVGDLWVCEGFAAGEGEGLQLSWDYP